MARTGHQLAASQFLPLLRRLQLGLFCCLQPGIQDGLAEEEEVDLLQLPRLLLARPHRNLQGDRGRGRKGR